MRTYFEKPRTSVGWKGLINDPDLDESFHINKGLRLARQAAARRQRPRAADRLRVSRHADSAAHRRPDLVGRDRRADRRRARSTASSRRGLSMPVGFKNSTDGSTQIAVDAVLTARSPHWFPSVTKQGVSAIFQTVGNDAATSSCAAARAPGRTTTPTTWESVRAARGQGAARARDGRLLARQQPQGPPAAG